MGRGVLAYNSLTGGMQEEADAIRRNDAIEEQRYQAEWDAKSGYEQALEISRRSTMGATPMGQVAGMILEKWFKNNQLPIIEQLDNQAAAQVTVPAPASVYGGTYNTTNNYNVASTNPAAAAQEIMRMQSSRDNLIEAQANGQFAAGVQ